MNQIAIGKRLTLGFGLLLALSLLGTLLGVWQLHAASVSTQAVIEQPLAKERLITDWYRLIHTAVRRTTAIAKSSDASLANYFAEEQKLSAGTTTEIQKKVEALMQTDAERALFADISALRRTYTESRDTVIRLRREGDADKADALLETRFVPAAKQYMGRVEALMELQRKALDQSATPIKAANDKARMWLIALGAITCGLGVVLAATITRSITRPLSESVAVADTIARGDLTAQVQSTSSDETGQLLRALADMQHSLASVIGQIRDAGNQIASASDQIAGGTQDLSSRTEHTAANLQQTASSMEQFTATVQQSAEAARTASTLASSAAEVASQGGSLVAQVVATMDDIHTSSRRIADIIGVIDGIAFQTNILALNAAVEAARAGEQGRGFAVVAGEVRSLAQRSAEAAKEIKGLISSSVEKVGAGTQLVQDAGAAMQNIVTSVGRVTEVVAHIAASAREQSDGIAMVNGAIAQLDQATQQNAALVEESAAAAQSLREQAHRLAEAASSFKVTEGMDLRRPAPAAVAPKPRLLPA
ncbi:MAG: methyl-accepting chemotaxis protein [Acidovorax sp.]|uniref:methyl-accepting chemotaxis protein n=1 Tax=Acidovorax sp. TaxID=1872122 RepID=UPI00262C3F28|nr:methyl-accepting chemotaxis protein [Acidovorax sp.]MDH4419741.1 methyl-accepting chemotaxis protein [Acidovorax sp.]